MLSNWRRISARPTREHHPKPTHSIAIRKVKRFNESSRELVELKYRGRQIRMRDFSKYEIDVDLGTWITQLLRRTIWRVVNEI